MQELDAASIEALRHVDVVRLLEELEPGVSGYLDRCVGDPAMIEELATEFCRLFLMSKATSPMLSVWLGGTRAGAGAGADGDIGATLSRRVDGWEAELGIELADGPWGNLPRDHIAVAVGVLAIALVRSAEDPRAGSLCVEIHRDVLAPAVPGFVDAVLAQSTNPVYRAGVKLLSTLLWNESETLEQPRPA